MSKLLDYINHLDKNADARDAHAADPTGHMTNYGLTQDEQDALLSGDRQRVADAIGISVDAMTVVHVPNSPF
jgi:hypothetical protein